MDRIKTIEFKDNILHLIDQRKLPLSYQIFQCTSYRDVDFAIKDMVVRGAPAIGVAGAYGVVLAAKEFIDCDRDDFLIHMDEALEILNRSRPTAVNLMWAINKMRSIIEENKDLPPADLYDKLRQEADRMLKQDIDTNRKMGKVGNEIVNEKQLF